MSTTEFKARCLEVLREVTRTGVPIVVTRRGKPVAQLASVVRRSPAKRKPLFGFLKGKIESRGDIIAPIDVAWNADRR